MSMQRGGGRGRGDRGGGGGGGGGRGGGGGGGRGGHGDLPFHTRGGGRGGGGRGDRGGGSGDGGGGRVGGGYRGGGDGGGRGGGGYRGGGDGGGRGGGGYRGGGDGGGRGGGGYRGGGGDGGGRGGGGGYRGGGGRGGRGGGPVEVFSNPNQTPAESQAYVSLVQNLVANTNLPVSKGPVNLTQEQIENPIRPGYGTKGDKVLVYSNHMQMALSGDITLYRYAITFPEEDRPGGQMEPKGKKRKRIVALLIEDHLKQYLDKSMPAFASDYSAILVSKKKLSLNGGDKGELFAVNYRGDDEDPRKEGEEEDADKPKQQVYNVLLQYTQEHSLSEIINSVTNTNVGNMLDDRRIEIIQSLNIIIGSHAKSNKDVISIGSNKHYLLNPAREDSWDLGMGLIALRGFFYSARAATAGMMLNVQVKSSAFYQSGPLADILYGVLQAHGGNIAAVAKFASGLSVFTTHLPVRKNKAGREIRRVKRIGGLATARDGKTKDHKKKAATNAFPPKVDCSGAGPSKVQFYLEPRDSKNGPAKYVTVRKYFQDNYPHIKLYPPHEELPVINLGTIQAPSYVPAEACIVVPGQPVNAMLKGIQTDRMRAQAVRMPVMNAKSIAGAGPRTIGIIDPANKTLASFGISINPNLVMVESRILKAPQPLYKNNKAVQIRKPGSWNMIQVEYARTGVLSGGGKITNLEFGTGNPDTIPTALSKTHMLRTFKSHGLTWINAPSRCPTVRDLGKEATEQERMIYDWVRDIASKGARVLFVLLPRREPNVFYNMVKRVCDVAVGIHSICVREDKVTTLKEGSEGQYWANVDLKLNLKLGGMNQFLDKADLGVIAEGKTMVVGLDVTHPSPGSANTAPSVAALVSSVDKDLAQFPAQISVQTARQERIDNLGNLLQAALKRWQVRNKVLPDNILVCRDGVSEGQYAMVRDEELRDLREGAAVMYSAQSKPPPKFAVVVVGKRHNTRFYPASAESQDQRGNLSAGTVVDRGVTELMSWDFFLQSHTAIQGTARPAHYYVVYDDIFRRHGVMANNNVRMHAHAADALEALMHNMCYMYGRATRSVSVCPAAYYADIACERARCYLSGLFEPTDAESVVSGDTRVSAPKASMLQDKAKVHDNIKETMFYI